MTGLVDARLTLRNTARRLREEAARERGHIPEVKRWAEASNATPAVKRAHTEAVHALQDVSDSLDWQADATDMGAEALQFLQDFTLIRSTAANVFLHNEVMNRAASAVLRGEKPDEAWTGWVERAKAARAEEQAQSDAIRDALAKIKVEVVPEDQRQPFGAPVTIRILGDGGLPIRTPRAAVYAAEVPEGHVRYRITTEPGGEVHCAGTMPRELAEAIGRREVTPAAAMDEWPCHPREPKPVVTNLLAKGKGGLILGLDDFRDFTGPGSRLTVTFHDGGEEEVRADVCGAIHRDLYEDLCAYYRTRCASGEPAGKLANRSMAQSGTVVWLPEDFQAPYIAPPAAE